MKKIVFILLFLGFFIYVKQARANTAFTFPNGAFTTTGSESIEGSYSHTFSSGLFTIPAIQLNFDTDKVGHYNLNYSLDNGTTWQSWQAATDSGSFTPAFAICVPTSGCVLQTFLNPPFVHYATGDWNLTDADLKLRITSLDASSFTISSITKSAEFYDNLPDSFANSLSSFTSNNPIVQCTGFDPVCSIEQWSINTIVFLFIPSQSFATDEFNTIKTTLNAKAPFAYFNAAFNIDVSNTASSTAIPTFTLPFVATGSAILGVPINIPTFSYTFPTAIHDALGTIRAVLAVGIWLLFIYFVLEKAREMFN